MTAFGGDQPVENVPRGTIFALLTIPVGVALWLVIWNFGFVASIVAFAVAFLATFLYRFGAGTIASTAGAVRVVVITIVTLLIALVAGFAWDIAAFYQDQGGIPWTDAIFLPFFWQDVFGWMFDGSNALTLLAALAFGALGSFATLRGVLQQARAQRQAAEAGLAGTTPGAFPAQPGAQPDPSLGTPPWTPQAQPPTIPPMPEAPPAPGVDPQR